MHKSLHINYADNKSGMHLLLIFTYMRYFYMHSQHVNSTEHMYYLFVCNICYTVLFIPMYIFKQTLLIF